ncbi:hypothetical protein DFH06DRAFT_1467499 [Mycena polygramma]|nr:hypothetical protein DFH06DRAFT_1482803 [Mycena polygramma]KAJ7673103.1 hypothetical protein DFH06DRAFT_1467499 [Mycena polygramma]
MSSGSPTLPSTYGAWLISLFLETILYGIGIVQAWLYVQWWWQKDGWSVKASIIIVMFFETTQISFFFRSTYFRFVQRFGLVQEDLIWSDSLQLLANYLTAFAVQIFFASRIYRLTRENVRMYRTSAVGIYIVIILALTQMSAGIAQTILSYRLRSFSKLDETKVSPNVLQGCAPLTRFLQAITTLQTAGSLSCDIVITVYLCVFLQRNKSGLPRSTEKMLNALMINAVNRGMLTAISSALTMVLFLVTPNTFWFFLGLAPNSKLYMNSMLATLNMRQHIRDKVLMNNLHTIQMGDIQTDGQQAGQMTFSAVEFSKPTPNDDSLASTTDYPSTDSMSNSKKES